MKKKLSVLLVLVLAVAISAYSVGGTYAKYTSTFEGATSTARVAKWAFEINDNEADATQEFTFDLFESVNDSNVATGTNENIIAPGTTGSFAIKLANKSEVNANYTVDYTVTNTANIPVEFSIDNGATWTTDLADVAATAINMNADTTITIQWKWAFTGAASENYKTAQTDVTDTGLGLDGTDTITVKADITVTQVD